MSISNDLMIVVHSGDLYEQIRAIVTARNEQYERLWDLVNDAIYDRHDYIRVREYRAFDDSYVDLSADVLLSAVRLLRNDASVMSLVTYKCD
jgi:hypothetical protein